MRSSSTLAVACARFVFLVLFLVLCSRRRYWQWYVLAGFADYDTPLAVFPSIVNVCGDSTGAVLGQGDMPVFVLSDASGQTAQKNVDFPQLPFAVFLRPFLSGRHLFDVRLWSTGLWTFLEDDFWKVSVFITSWFDSGYMLRQFTEAVWFRLQKTVESPRLQSIVGREADSHGLAVQQTTAIPRLQFLYVVFDVPVVQVVQVHFCRGAEAVSYGPDCSSSHKHSPVAVLGGSSPCCAGRAGSFPCRDAEADSHGHACLKDHRDFAVAVRAGWSMSLLCRSSWIPGAVVKETVEISQLLLLRNRWLPVVLAALRGGVGLKGFFLKGPVHRHRAWGRVHRDTVPIIRCISCGVMDKHFVVTSCLHHHHHHPRFKHTRFPGVRRLLRFVLVTFHCTFMWVMRGGLAQCCTRCESRQEAARTTVTPVPSAGTAYRRHAPGRDSAPRRPKGTEQGQERERGSSCTTRPNSGSASPPGGPASTSV